MRARAEELLAKLQAGAAEIEIERSRLERQEQEEVISTWISSRRKELLADRALIVNLDRVARR